MSLKEQRSYWLCCDGGDANGKCHSAVGPSRDLGLLRQRATGFGWQVAQSWRPPLLENRVNGDGDRCARHRIEVRT